MTDADECERFGEGLVWAGRGPVWSENEWDPLEEVIVESVRGARMSHGRIPYCSLKSTHGGQVPSAALDLMLALIEPSVNLGKVITVSPDGLRSRHGEGVPLPRIRTRYEQNTWLVEFIDVMLKRVPEAGPWSSGKDCR